MCSVSVFRDLCRPSDFIDLQIFIGPLSSVSSLEVNFDLLDLTELTDVSDQEVSEVFVELEEDDHNDLPSSEFPYPHTALISGLSDILNKKHIKCVNGKSTKKLFISQRFSFVNQNI